MRYLGPLQRAGYNEHGFSLTLPKRPRLESMTREFHGSAITLPPGVRPGPWLDLMCNRLHFQFLTLARMMRPNALTLCPFWDLFRQQSSIPLLSVWVHAKAAHLFDHSSGQQGKIQRSSNLGFRYGLTA